jgi:Flp pilus assembly secretin CpaC
MKAFFGAAVAGVLSMMGAAYAQDLPVRFDLEMLIGGVHILDLERSYGLVLIGNNDVADTSIVTGTTIAVVAKKEGRTTMIFLDDENQAFANAEIQVRPESRGLGKRQVTVRTFTDGGKKVGASTFYCETDAGRNGACSFSAHKVDKSDSAATASTVINLGSTGTGPTGTAVTTAN